jgi:hypothetical protein
MADQKLKFRFGGGRTAEVDMDVAAGYQGQASDVIRRILAEHVEDSEEKQQMLDGPVVFDQLTDDVERPISPTHAWSDIVDRAAQAQYSEIGVGQRHTGGGTA